MARSTKGIRHQKMENTRAQVLRAAVELFLKQGYNGTTAVQIAGKIGRSTAAMFRAYPDKEAILYALVTHMFSSQFDNARRLLGEEAEALLVYGVETALQLHICELSEALRDVYISAYTLPSTSEYIYRNTAKEMHRVFADYMPDAAESDFYELEIASGNVMRGYMARKCDMYFPMERKLRLLLSCCFKIYEVPPQKREEVIQRVLAMDIETMAKRLIEQTVRLAESGFGPEVLEAKKNG